MKKYYISSIDGQSGICKYSKDFYELVLREKGYAFIDSNASQSNILDKIMPSDHVHIEIGIFQERELKILFTFLQANYQNITVTLHDPPLLKYPFTKFKNSFLNKVSKFYDIYINRFSASGYYINKIKTIYVLSRGAVELIKTKYKIKHVYFLPHIIDEKEAKKSECNNKNFIYFGFIGKNKGIEYSLQLHQHLLTSYPDINFYVVGKAIGKEIKFYNSLKEKYKTNVHYLGYVPESRIDEIFDKATFALMLFKPYKFFAPISGSIFYNLKKGKIIFTNKVNVVSEIVSEGVNGFYLSGIMKEDIATISRTFSDKQKLNKVRELSRNYLIQHHTAKVVSEVLELQGINN